LRLADHTTEFRHKQNTNKVGEERGVIHRCKNVFYVFFYFGHVFTFLTFFIFQRYFILKNVEKVQSGKQISKKHFQNNSNEIDL